MRLSRALGYLVGEAALSLRRGWKVSLLAVLAIATSLFVGGLFLLLAHNLAAAAQLWRSQAQIVVYLLPGSTSESSAPLAAWIGGQRGVVAVTLVPPATAGERLTRGFPGLAELWEAPGGLELPVSLEVSLAPEVDAGAARELVAALRSQPGVDLVDDDRDWLERLEGWVAIGKLAGLGLGGLLLAAAVFTIYSVLRLTAHLYRQEIAVLRLVGATELLIRAPFYLEGLLQGLLGGALALGCLALVHFGAARAVPGLLGLLLLGRFLPPASCAALVALGAAAGLLGAVLSLRREVVAEFGGSAPLAG